MERDGEKEETKAQQERLRELARWISAQPWNAPGTDKTWVFRVWDEYRRLFKEFRRVDD